jgi:hypothetical protein
MLTNLIQAVTHPGQAFMELLRSILVTAVQGPLTFALHMYASTGTIRILLYQPWAQDVLHISTALGATLVAMRIGWEALMQYITRTSGGTSDPMELVRGGIRATLGVVAAPWLAVQTIAFTNDLAKWIASAGFGGPGALLTQFHSFITPIAGSAQFVSSLVFTAIALAISIVLVLLIWVLSMIRTIEALLYGLAGPVLAVGWVNEGGGTFATWWSGLLGVGMAQCVQMLMLYVSAAVVAGGSNIAGSVLTAPFLMVAALWVAYKAPDFVQRFLYHTGTGGAVGGVANTVTTTLIRNAITR